MYNCPSAPILNTPPLNPSATARPVRIYGVAATPVSLKACHHPHTPANNPPYASSTLAPLVQMRPAPRSKATLTAMRGVRLAVQCCSGITQVRSLRGRHASQQWPQRLTASLVGRD